MIRRVIWFNSSRVGDSSVGILAAAKPVKVDEAEMKAATNTMTG